MSEEKGRRSRFQEDLNVLQERLLEMAELVERGIAEAVGAVLERDPSVAERVHETDRSIDALEIEIDERVLELLALQQPLATDLRRIVMTNKISNDLERMGDHAVNISEAARRLAAAHPLPDVRELREMASVVRAMVSDALSAYVSRSAAKARAVCTTDDRVDDLRTSMYRILVTHMLEDPKRIGAALELLLVSQNLERIGDLATNIAEDVVFVVEGRTIKHGLEAGPGAREQWERGGP